MIRYALACDEGHAFESWFANSATYNRQVKRGLVSCPVCNSTKVEKAIMAPRGAGRKRRGDASVSAPMPEGPASSQPSASKAPPEAPQTNVPAPVAMMSPLTVAFQAKAGEEGFQIYVAPIIGTKITEERFMMNEPSGVRNDQTETSVDGAQALAFHGFDAVMEQTCTKCSLSKAIFSTKSPHTKSSNLGSKAIYINP
jgi:Protein of unknown function (DUF1178)